MLFGRSVFSSPFLFALPDTLISSMLMVAFWWAFGSIIFREYRRNGGLFWVQLFIVAPVCAWLFLFINNTVIPEWDPWAFRFHFRYPEFLGIHHTFEGGMVSPIQTHLISMMRDYPCSQAPYFFGGTLLLVMLFSTAVKYGFIFFNDKDSLETWQIITVFFLIVVPLFLLLFVLFLYIAAIVFVILLTPVLLMVVIGTVPTE